MTLPSARRPLLMCTDSGEYGIIMHEGYHVWQSRVEIKHYSVVQFDCVTVFEALWRKTSVKGMVIHAAKMHEYMYLLSLCSCMSPTLNKSSALQCFECSNTVIDKIHNGIMLDFYPGLPHIYHGNPVYKTN